MGVDWGHETGKKARLKSRGTVKLPIVIAGELAGVNSFKAA